MGGVLGALAGGGMLLLVGCMICAFGREMGWLSKARLKWLGKCFGMILMACVVYRLMGALIYFVFYGTVGDATEYNIIFRSPGLEKMYDLLQNPRWEGILTGLFAYLGHGLGEVLFGQHLLGGEVLAFLCTFAGSGLMLSRLQRILGEKAGEEILFIFLCMPFAVFLFLPGWGPLAYLLAAFFFYFLGRRLPERHIAIPPPVYSLLIALFSMLSAVMVYILAVGMMM